MPSFGDPANVLKTDALTDGHPDIVTTRTFRRHFHDTTNFALNPSPLSLIIRFTTVGFANLKVSIPNKYMNYLDQR
jgi:hypothetical protein